MPDDLMPDDPMPDDLMPDDLMPDDLMPDDLMPDDLMPDDLMPDDLMPDIGDIALSFTQFFDSMAPDPQSGHSMIFTLPVSDAPVLQNLGQDPPLAFFTDGMLAGLNYTLPPGQGTVFEDILQQSLDDRVPYKTVLDESKESGIKYGVVAEGEEIICSIAQGSLDPGDQTAILPCGHTFERDPILQWLKTERAECPVCRASLAGKEVRDEPSEAQGVPLPQDDTLLPEPMVYPYMDALNALIHESLQRAAEREEEMVLQAALMESLRLN